ncbi:MAG: Crp/Fnr family transcriptional regulator [Lewinella sp.]|nr:Crp/Fnr family transcriptional regulator [Lewinella sp.]
MAGPFDPVKPFLDAVYPLSQASFMRLAGLFEERAIERGTVFAPCRRSNQSEYFIREGVARSYLLSPEGDDITIQFFQAPAVASPHITRTENGLSLLNFEAVTDLRLISFPAQDLVDLMIDNLEVRFWANTVLTNELIRKVNKEIGLASLTAKERLLRFREDFDGLENLVPHPMIASYLGITNISLSRLRRELAG